MMACGPQSAESASDGSSGSETSSSGATTSGTTGTSSGDEPTTGGTTGTTGPVEEPIACAVPAGEPCPECFLMLAAVDHSSQHATDEWFAFDGAERTVLSPRPADYGALAAVTEEGLGVAMYIENDGTGIGFITYEDGAWGEGQPIGVPVGVTPVVSASEGRCVHLIYRDDQQNFFHALFDGAAWHLPDAPLASRGNWGSLAARDGELVFVFQDPDKVGTLSSQRRTSEWKAPEILGESDADDTPRVVALGGEAEFLVVHGARYSVRKGGSWSALKDIPGAETSGSESVTSLRDGRALAGWFGPDAVGVIVSIYDGATDTWGPPQTIADAPMVAGPVVAAGRSGGDFEVFFTEHGNQPNLFFAHHERMIDGVQSNAWIGFGSYERFGLATNVWTQ